MISKVFVIQDTGIKYHTMFHVERLTMRKLYDNCNNMVKIQVVSEEPSERIQSKVIRNTLIAIYLAQGYSANKIKKLAKCGQDAITRVKRGEAATDTQLASKIKDTLSARCTIAASIMLERATDPDKLDKASTFQLAGAGGLLMQNARLLEGESTANISVRSVHNDVSVSLDKLKCMLKDTQ